MRRWTASLSILLLVFIVFPPLYCFAQEDPQMVEAVKSKYNAQLEECKREIEDWSNQKKQLIALNIFVVVVGLVISGLQLIGKFIRNKSIKIWSVVLGLLVSALTYVINNVYDEDHRSLKEKISTGKKISREIDIMLTRINKGDIDKNINEISLKFSEFSDLELARNKSYPTKKVDLFIVREANAQTQESSSVYESEDKRFLFISGVSTGSDLGELIEQSEKDARAKTRDYFIKRMEGDNISKETKEKLAEFIERSARVSDKSLSQINDPLLLRHITVLVLDKRNIILSIDVFAIKNKVMFSQDFKERLLGSK